MASIDFRPLDDTVYSHLFKRKLRDYPTPVLLPLEADDLPPLHAPQQGPWACSGSLRITGVIRPSGGVRMICVYSGELKEDGTSREVAVKLGDCDELWDEVDIFGRLQSLKGTHIPRLVAFFRVKKSKRGYFGCLITERFGDFLQERLCDLDRSVKAKLMTHLTDFHRLGVALKDFSSRHVLISAGDVRIGNLEEGVHHDCQREATYDFFNAPIYLKEQIDLCHWLKSQADNMDFWEPSSVKIFSHWISKSSLPSDMEIVQALKPTSLFERYESCDMWSLLRIYYEMIRDELEGGVPPEDLLMRIEEFEDEAAKQWDEFVKNRKLRYGA